MTRTATFTFRLDTRSGVPVYRQLIDQVQAGIASGNLASGEQIPTVRQVAVDLEINPNTVLRAYRELGNSRRPGYPAGHRHIHLGSEGHAGRRRARAATGATGERIRGASRAPADSRCRS